MKNKYKNPEKIKPLATSTPPQDFGGQIYKYIERERERKREKKASSILAFFLKPNMFSLSFSLNVLPFFFFSLFSSLVN